MYLDCVSTDGATGFVARLARHVDEGATWLWAHAFLPGGVVAFHDQDLACDGGRTAVDGAGVEYRQSGSPGASFRRHGLRNAMTGAGVHVEVSGHSDGFAPAGSGPVPLIIDASFTPVRAAGGTLPGRTEVLGRVSAAVVVDGVEHGVEGWAQWHEQHQTEPRFTVPFTYATVRGDALGAVLVRGPRRSGGLLWRGEKQETVLEFDLSPPGAGRSLSCRLADGSTVRGMLQTVQRYAVGINGSPRPGTLVSGDLGGSPVSGCVNDWTPVGAVAP